MFVLLGSIFTFEMLGVFNTRFVTLTQIFKTFLPISCRLMFCAWLSWHFVGSDIVTAIVNRTPLK